MTSGDSNLGLVVGKPFGHEGLHYNSGEVFPVAGLPERRVKQMVEFRMLRPIPGVVTKRPEKKQPEAATPRAADTARQETPPPPKTRTRRKARSAADNADNGE